MTHRALAVVFAALLLAAGCGDEGRTSAGTGPVAPPTRAAEPEDVRAASVEDAWDEAQLRGIDFRAIGLDPSWVLEIDEGKGLLFTLEGQPFNFPGADVTLDAASPVWTYTTSSGQHQLVVRIDEGPCEVPNGGGETARVTVTLDGTPYVGCGRGID